MTGPDNGLTAVASAWREADPDPETRAELDRLLGTVGTVGMAETGGRDGTGGAVPAGPPPRSWPSVSRARWPSARPASGPRWAQARCE